MNQQRLVAGIAALAIGFAVTLVGVGVADDEIAENPTPADQQIQELDDDGGSDDDQRAEQDEEVAEEPEAAESEAPSEPTAQEGEPAPAPTSAPVPTNAPDTTSAPDGNQAEPGQDRPVADNGIECRRVLLLDYNDGTDFVVVIDEVGDGRYLVLDSDGDFVIDLGEEEGLEDFEFLDRFVEIQNGNLVSLDIDAPCDGGDGSPGGDLGDSVDAALAGEVFPCSDEAFEGLARPLSNLELTELIDDRDVFAIGVARRLASLGSTSEDDWLAALDQVFASFAEFPDGCSEEIESAFIGTGFEFFCAAARVSSDTDLFRFFQNQVGPAMVGCTYEDESAQGGN